MSFSGTCYHWIFETTPPKSNVGKNRGASTATPSLAPRRCAVRYHGTWQRFQATNSGWRSPKKMKNKRRWYRRSPTARRFACFKVYTFITSFSLPLLYWFSMQPEASIVAKYKSILLKYKSILLYCTKVYFPSTKVYFPKYTSILSKYKSLFSIYKVYFQSTKVPFQSRK